MALPPIIANNPIIKLFQTGQKNNVSAKETAPPQETKAGATPQDIVELSEAARQKLDRAKVGPLETDQDARQAARHARDALAGHDTQTLGLDPGFVS